MAGFASRGGSSPFPPELAHGDGEGSHQKKERPGGVHPKEGVEDEKGGVELMVLVLMMIMLMMMAKKVMMMMMMMTMMMIVVMMMLRRVPDYD